VGSGTLGDGFSREGQPSFTSGPDFGCGVPGQTFFDVGCYQRTGAWALDILGVDDAVPEPGTLGLFGWGLVGLAGTRRSRTTR
jgi:hypothetical protein